MYCSDENVAKRFLAMKLWTLFLIKYMYKIYMFRAFYQSAQFINWPAQSRNYRLGAQFINRVRNLEIESRASNERSVHVLFIA